MRACTFILTVGLFGALVAQEDVTFPNVGATFNETWPCQDPSNGPWTMSTSFGFTREPFAVEDSLAWSSFGSGLLAISGDRVHYRTEEAEIVLYDFGLALGDTAYVDAYHDHGPTVVVGLDIINVVGRPRKRFSMDNGDVWVQGIGSLMGPLRPTYGTPLGCSDPIYSFCADYVDSADVPYTVCLEHVVGMQERAVRATHLQVMPNPAQDQFAVLGTVAGVPYRLMDLAGNTVQEGRCAEGRTQVLRVGMASGVYLFDTPAGRGKVLLE